MPNPPRARSINDNCFCFLFQHVVPTENKTDFSLDSISYPELPKLPEPARPKSQSNGAANGPAQPTKPAPPSNIIPPQNGIDQPAATTTPQRPSGHTTAFGPGQISQNVPSAGKRVNPPTLQNNDTLARSQNAQNLPPSVSNNLPLPNSSAQGGSNAPRQPSPNTTPNARVSKVPSNNNNVVKQGQNSPQGLNSPQQPGGINSSIAQNCSLPAAKQTLPGQTTPNAPQAKGNGQGVPSGYLAQAPMSLPNNLSQAGTALSQNQPQKPQTMVAPQLSTSTVTSKTAPQAPRAQPPSFVTFPQHPSQHHTGVPSTQPPNSVGSQPNTISLPQFIPPAISPTLPQGPMAQQLRPNVSGILPKMPTRNPPTTQPNTPASTTQGPQSKPTPIPTSSTPVPQSQASAQRPIPNVAQTFTSSRTGMTHGLPPGWERVLDRKTGRYYFQDHNTKTTHWNLPESLAQSMNKSILGHNTATVKEVEPKKPSLKRSLSSPNLAKIADDEPKSTAPKSGSSRPTVNRMVKPLTETQLANLSPTHGGHGKALTGLRNLGNSCYMNSVLQCLFATFPMAKYILNSYYLDDINKTNPLGTGGRIAEELAVLIRVAYCGKYRSVSPYEFKRTIGRFAPEFGGTKQQDSQEFLLVLLDQFHEDTNRVRLCIFFNIIEENDCFMYSELFYF